MAYIWFESVLEALGKRINYDAIVNLFGNAFAKDASKLVAEANPLVKNGGKVNTGVMGLLGNIKIINSKSDKTAENKALMKDLGGDMSWAEEFL